LLPPQAASTAINATIKPTAKNRERAVLNMTYLSLSPQV
jgi:hypothetical protein